MFNIPHFQSFKKILNLTISFESYLKKMMFDIRCCEEEDCPDILTFFKDNICATFIKEKYEFSEVIIICTSMYLKAFYLISLVRK